LYGTADFLHRLSTAASVAGAGSSAILPAVEQLRGPVIPPVHAAGTDPAYIPGLTPPGPDRAAEDPGEPEEVVEEPTGDASGDDSGDAAGPDAVDAAAAEGPGDPEEEEEEQEGDGDGPAFEVSDHRGSIAAGRSGVVFRLDGEEARFSWDEIGAVEVDVPRFGRRFAVSVCTTARRWYEADVDAPSRKVLKGWAEEFDAVLDAWFEED
jgi:hypothetical protein